VGVGVISTTWVVVGSGVKVSVAGVCVIGVSVPSSLCWTALNPTAPAKAARPAVDAIASFLGRESFFFWLSG